MLNLVRPDWSVSVVGVSHIIENNAGYIFVKTNIIHTSMPVTAKVSVQLEGNNVRDVGNLIIFLVDLIIPHSQTGVPIPPPKADHAIFPLKTG